MKAGDQLAFADHVALQCLDQFALARTRWQVGPGIQRIQRECVAMRRAAGGHGPA